MGGKVAWEGEQGKTSKRLHNKKKQKQLRKDVQAIQMQVRTLEVRATGNVARKHKRHDLQLPPLEITRDLQVGGEALALNFPA